MKIEGDLSLYFLDQDFAHLLTRSSAALEYNVSPLPRTHFTLGYSRHWFVRDQDDVHAVALEGDYWPTPEWQIHALLSVVMDQVVTATNNPFRQQHLPDYGLINLRVARYFPACGLKVYAGADNLTNTRYEFAPGFPAPGATYLIGAQIGF